MQMEAPYALALGSQVADRYLLQQRLGAGGMGEVFLAHDSVLESSPVAIKFLYPHLVADNTALARFRNEVLVARRLTHPTIVRTFNLEVADSRAFIVMEYVDGVSLRDLLRREFPEGMPFNQLTYFASVIARGMHHSHQMGIIHRDLKPDNVMINQCNEVKLNDFGLSATLRRQTQLTRAGHLMGTPYYMAPEQFRGETVAVTADIYSFGIMLYELALGRVPFSDSSLYGLARQHERDPLFIPKDKRSLLPESIWQIVVQATNKQPEERFQGFDEISNALAELDGAPKLPEITSSYSIAEAGSGSHISTPPERRFWTRRRIAYAYLVYLLLSSQTARNNAFARAISSVPILWAESLLHTRLTWLRTLYGVTVDFTSLSLAEELQLGSHTAAVRVIAGDDPNAERNRNRDGEYVLHVAATKSSVTPITIQLAFGADPNLTAYDGSTPLHRAVESHDTEIAELLLKYGASPDVVAKNGNTPLLIAAQTGDEAMAILLVKAGADPHRVDREGRSTVAYATAQKKLKLLEAVAASGGNS